MINLLSKKISIIGAGKSGVSAARLASHMGAEVLLSDSRLDLNITNLNNINIELGGHSDKVLESDFIIKSPGVSNNIEIIKKAKSKKIRIISEIEFAGLFTELPIIGITGSNGKTTAVELLNKIFKKAGYNSILGGNVGIPFSDNVLDEILTKQKEGIHILELSSFQLEETSNLSLDVGCLLNISEDHLDRHKNFQDYIDAKLKIMELTRDSGSIVYNKDDQILRE